MTSAELAGQMGDLDRARAAVVEAEQAMGQAIAIHRRRLEAGDKLGAERAINAAFRVWAQSSIDYQQKQLELLASACADAESRIAEINSKLAKALGR